MYARILCLRYRWKSPSLYLTGQDVTATLHFLRPSQVICSLYINYCRSTLDVCSSHQPTSLNIGTEVVDEIVFNKLYRGERGRHFFTKFYKQSNDVWNDFYFAILVMDHGSAKFYQKDYSHQEDLKINSHFYLISKKREMIVFFVLDWYSRFSIMMMMKLISTWFSSSWIVLSCMHDYITDIKIDPHTTLTGCAVWVHGTGRLACYFWIIQNSKLFHFFFCAIISILLRLGHLLQPISFHSAANDNDIYQSSCGWLEGFLPIVRC